MNEKTYPESVSQLLTLGEIDYFGGGWPDYLKLGLGPDDVPHLIRMATDESLDWVDGEDAEIWAAVHACHALGQLRAEEAVQPLLDLLTRLGQDNLDEWTMEDYPRIFEQIGPAAIPALVAYLNDPAHGLYPRGTVADGLVRIGNRYPEARDECVAAITDQLARFAENDPGLNANLVTSLLDLKAKESLPVIEQVFEADRVDEFMVGWTNVQTDLGLPAGYRDDLKPEEMSHKRARQDELSSEKSEQKSKVQQKRKQKQKRKQVQKSRKKNRKRK